MSLEEIYKNFQNPPRNFSPIPFWFLNNDLKEEEIIWALDEFEKKHIFGAVLHPRTGLEINYLSDEYFQKIKFIIEEMKKRNQFIILYDEYNWPSGTIGGKLLREHPEFKQKFLDYKKYKLKKNKKVEFKVEGEFLAAFLVNLTTKEVNNVTNLFDGEKISITSKKNKCEIIIYYIRLMNDLLYATTCAPNTKAERGYIDLLNPSAVKYFIEQTHEQYKERFGEDFGKDIIGFFTDEPGNYAGYMWTDDFLNYFKNEKNYDLIPQLYKLVYEIDDYIKIKNDYHEVALKLYENSFYKQIGDWCNENNLKLTGHLVMEEDLNHLPRIHGDLFSPYRNFGIPGIDYLSDKHAYEIKRSLFLANPNFTPKFISSISHAIDAERTLCEIYGGCNWQTTLEKLKNVMLWMSACGVNLFNFHASHLSLKGLRKRDFPASHFVQEPWWNYYSIFSDLAMKLSFFNTIGIHKANFAILFPKRTFWTEYTAYNKSFLFKKLISEFPKIGDILLRIQFDYDYIFEEEILENFILVQGKKILLKNEEYDGIILPPMTTISKNIYEFIKEYFDKGGIIICFGMIPQNSITLKNDPEIQSISSNLFGNSSLNKEVITTNTNGGKVIFIPFSKFEDKMRGEGYLEELFLREKIPNSIRIKSESKRDFIYQHRINENLNFYLICNMSSNYNKVRITLSNSGYLEIWDPEDGSRYNFKQIQGEFEFNFKPNQALIFVLTPNRNDLEDWPQELLRIKEIQPILLNKNWNIELESKNKYVLDNWNLKILSSKPLDSGQIQKNKLIYKKLNKRTRYPIAFFKLIFKLAIIGKKTKNTRYSAFEMLDKWGPLLAKIFGINFTDGFAGFYELMEIIGVITGKLGIKLRDFQPGDEIEISKKFCIKEMPNQEIRLIYEDLEMPIKIEINNKIFDKAELEEKSENIFIWDRSNRTISIKDYLKNGKNKVKIRMKLPEFPDLIPSYHGIEPFTLIGDFIIKKNTIYLREEMLEGKDWSKQGLGNYSGGIWYKQEFHIEENYLKYRLFLEFDAVNETIEVKINGKNVGTRLWKPYKLEITDNIKEGINELEIFVKNTAANFFAFPKKSGILGAVKITPYKE